MLIINVCISKPIFHWQSDYFGSISESLGFQQNPKLRTKTNLQRHTTIAVSLIISTCLIMRWAITPHLRSLLVRVVPFDS
jgi:hypothetical protein